MPARLGHRLAAPARDHGVLAGGQVGTTSSVESHGIDGWSHCTQASVRAVGGQPRGRDEVGPGDQHLGLRRRVGAPAARSRCARRSPPGRSAARARRPGWRRPGRSRRRRSGRRATRAGSAVSGCGPRRGRAGRAAGRPIGEPGDAVADPPRPAAVLVHGGAGAHALGQQLGGGAVGGPPDQLGPPALGRSALGPHQVLPVDRELTEPDGGRDDEIGGDRGGPGSERGGGRRHGMNVRAVRGVKVQCRRR